MKFKPASATARQEVLDYAKEELKVYAIDADDSDDYASDAYFKGDWEVFKSEAIKQGRVWNLNQFEEGLNTEVIWVTSLFIKIL